MNGAPAKPISGVAPSSRDQHPHRLGDGSDVVGLQRPEPVEVGRGPDRLGDHRPDPGHDVEVDADRLERHDDVAEQDRRVHAVPAHRLQGDLGDELRRPAGLEHRDALAEPAVLRQRPARLAHEPDRRVRHRLASAGAQERRVLHGRGVQGGGGDGHAADGVTRCSRPRSARPRRAHRDADRLDAVRAARAAARAPAARSPRGRASRARPTMLTSPAGARQAEGQVGPDVTDAHHGDQRQVAPVQARAGTAPPAAAPPPARRPPR